MIGRTGTGMKFVVAIALPLLGGGGPAWAQAAGSPAPTSAERPTVPDASLLAGLDLYGSTGDEVLGTVDRVVRRGDGYVAVVNVGKGSGRVSGAAVALPVSRIYVDGVKIRANLSQSQFRGMALSAPG